MLYYLFYNSNLDNWEKTSFFLLVHIKFEALRKHNVSNQTIFGSSALYWFIELWRAEPQNRSTVKTFRKIMLQKDVFNKTVSKNYKLFRHEI